MSGMSGSVASATTKVWRRPASTFVSWEAALGTYTTGRKVQLFVRLPLAAWAGEQISPCPKLLCNYCCIASGGPPHKI
eukprot:853249-Pelagomonas_calceolata.AAC.1